MGGDHKCPVCSAAFTRPQHVVRHMRSHTGDRPYKCQQCGDQFSRSDLLSRHVNKCHIAASGSGPNRGHPPTGRRKGLGANATRATTSKQACDQCVQSSLPCDGANPCGKCIQRKIRCTFVKFHRQTAPIGPGHGQTRVPTSVFNPNLPSSSSSLIPQSGPFSFGGAYPSYDPPPGGYADGDSLLLQPAPGTSAANHHRAQQDAELHRRASFPSFPGQQWINGWHASAHPPSPHFDPGAGQFAFNVGDYREQQRFTLRHPHAPPSQHVYQQQQNNIHPHPHAASSASLHSASSSSSNHDSRYDYGYRSRPGTSASDASTSDISRPGTSSSFTSSRPGTSQKSHSENGHGPRGDNNNNITGTTSTNPGFSSSFGLMSLDDPAVLAGLANDGIEFFSHLAGEDHPNSHGVDTGRVLHLADGGVVDLGSMGGGIPGGGGGMLRESDDPDATPMPMGEAQAMGLVGPEHSMMDPSSNDQPSSASPHSHPNQHPHQPSHQFQPPVPRTRPSTGHGRYLNPHHHPHSPHSTQFPPPDAGTPGNKEAETRELREFWKAYMRTPSSAGGLMHGITGPHAIPPPPPSQQNHTHYGNGNGTEESGAGTGYRRPRVSSLPSVKTPLALDDEDRYGYTGFVGFNGVYNHQNSDNAGGYPPLGSVSHSHSSVHPGSQHQQYPHQQPSSSSSSISNPAPPALPPPPLASLVSHGPSGTMTNHGNAEDLRSYEAAVLARAREAPVNLSMQGKMMRRNKSKMGVSGRGGKDGSGSGPGSAVVAGSGSGPGAGVGAGVASSPSPSASSSMSSASVASSPAMQQQFSSASPAAGTDIGSGSERLSGTPESTLSGNSGEEDVGGGGAGAGAGETHTAGGRQGPASHRPSRPSFKRLASQVLEKGGSGKVARV